MNAKGQSSTLGDFSPSSLYSQHHVGMDVEEDAIGIGLIYPVRCICFFLVIYPGAVCWMTMTHISLQDNPIGSFPLPVAHRWAKIGPNPRPFPGEAGGWCGGPSLQPQGTQARCAAVTIQASCFGRLVNRVSGKTQFEGLWTKAASLATLSLP